MALLCSYWVINIESVRLEKQYLFNLLFGVGYTSALLIHPGHFKPKDLRNITY